MGARGQSRPCYSKRAFLAPPARGCQRRPLAVGDAREQPRFVPAARGHRYRGAQAANHMRGERQPCIPAPGRSARRRGDEKQILRTDLHLARPLEPCRLGQACRRTMTRLASVDRFVMAVRWSASLLRLCMVRLQSGRSKAGGPAPPALCPSARLPYRGAPSYRLPQSRRAIAPSHRLRLDALASARYR